MKKVIVMTALCVGTVFTSCSKNDDGPEQDPIIGTWLLVESSKVEDGQTLQDELSDCEKKSGPSFMSDGTFESNSYDLEGDECILDDATQGKWENLGDGVYQSEHGGSTFEQKIVFSGNTFSINSESGDITYIDVYQKVD